MSPKPKKPRVDQLLLKDLYGPGEEDKKNQFTRNLNTAETIRIGFPTKKK
jgi:hypothetical protein